MDCLAGLLCAPPKRISGNVETDANRQRKLFFKELSTALWNASEDEGNKGSYAGGGDIASNQQGCILESVHVEGVGDLRLPLSSDDVAKLLSHRVCKKAPYSHGLATKVDLKVRRAWQVDASKVTFPHSPDFLSKTVPLIAKKAVRALGMNGTAVQIEARLYKLLLYEPGGHFARHRDTEKEPGMFATLVLQLPTQEGYEGGELVVQQSGTTKTFDFSFDSATKFFYTIFYADCEHELQEVTTGKRLCLSFNLVRGNDSFNTPLEELKGYSSRLSKVEAALQPWLQAMTREEPLKVGDTFFKTEKLAIPLEHKYTKKNLSFSGLKENDRIVAQVLQNCRDASGSRSLDLHLCILTLHQFGSAEEGYDDHHKMIEVCDESLESSTWIGTNNKPCNFTMEIDDKLEVVIDEDIQNKLFA